MIGGRETANGERKKNHPLPARRSPVSRSPLPQILRISLRKNCGQNDLENEASRNCGKRPESPVFFLSETRRHSGAGLLYFRDLCSPAPRFPHASTAATTI